MKLTASLDSLTLRALGDTARITTTAKDASGRDVTSQTSVGLTWLSLNANVVSVSSSGLVTALSNGRTNIIVTTGVNISDTVSVLVQQSPSAISISPESLSVATGTTAQLTASVTDANGVAIAGAPVSWSSTAPTVAAVDSHGMVTALSSGSAMIKATTSGPSGIASGDGPSMAAATVTGETSVSVAPSAPGLPGTVADLQVAAMTPTSVTLRWTQADDGAGKPASYALRYGTPNLSWGDAIATEAFLSGTKIGSTLTYTFSGLQAGTGYQFGLVAYRGTPNVDAVYGELSNMATASTSSQTTVVKTVIASPATATITALGAVVQLSATAKDGAGVAVPDVSFLWTSLNPTVATVDADGAVTGKVNGSAKVVVAATCCATADTVAITVSQQASKMILTPDSIGLTAGGTAQISASVRDSNDQPIAGAQVTWSSQDTTTAKVSASGLVTGRSGARRQ